MKSCKWLIGCALIVMLSAASSFALPTADEVLQKAIKSGESVKTYAADMKMKMSMGPMSMTATGKTVGMRDTADGKTLKKSYQDMTMRVPGRDGRPMEIKQKVVSDGKIRWTEMRHPSMPAPRVTKSRADAKNRMGMPADDDPATQIKTFMEMFDLKVTGTANVGTVACYVLEGTFKESYLEKNAQAEMMKAMMGKVKMYVGQQDMFPRKIVGMDADGNETMSVETTNVKLNGKVDESLFKYTPPAGASIQDNTGN